MTNLNNNGQLGHPCRTSLVASNELGSLSYTLARPYPCKNNAHTILTKFSGAEDRKRENWRSVCAGILGTKRRHCTPYLLGQGQSMPVTALESTNNRTVDTMRLLKSRPRKNGGVTGFGVVRGTLDFSLLKISLDKARKTEWIHSLDSLSFRLRASRANLKFSGHSCIPNASELSFAHIRGHKLCISKLLR